LVYPCLPLASNTVYPVYTPIYLYCIPCIPLYILCTHVYPNSTVYPNMPLYLVYPCFP
ncbi:unnamed protein product, partial [Porites lobata]